MNFIKKYFEHIGLTKEDIESKEIKQYKINGDGISLVIRYLDYLKEQHKHQQERQTTIENKNSQLVGQAGVIISIFTLFIPLLIDKLMDLSLMVLILLILGFVIIMFHYLLTIFHSTKTLGINKYKYATRTTKTVTGSGRKTDELSFLEQEINDLIYIIDTNSVQDNRKASNLIYATRSFRIASFSFVIFTLFIIGISFFISSKPHAIDIKSIDSSIYTKSHKLIQEQQIDYHSEIKEMSNKVSRLENKLFVMDSMYKKILTESINDSINVK
ncbi:hypothetical protein [Flammeovirga aprica]|uniref:Uncharacterized protein n=1 Tax=Flammeovirga aprica JL-4 TaxID=694437 RepID=A0A7X9S1J8_9BACT|nr:hypothetical protein [Flammeovirga aprica]NME72653.1 hypothetical protein [Flammeovirga aprica JL-4]